MTCLSFAFSSDDFFLYFPLCLYRETTSTSHGEYIRCYCRLFWSAINMQLFLSLFYSLLDPFKVNIIQGIFLHTSIFSGYSRK